MNRWNKILRVFTAEYLGLSPDTDTKNPARQVDELVRAQPSFLKSR